MTRHLCAVDVLLVVTAAGAAPIRSTAGTRHPTATAAASEALRLFLRRIGFQFLSRPAERAEGHRRSGPKTFPGSLHTLRGKVKPLFHIPLSGAGITLPERSGTCFNRAMAVAPRVTIREIADRAGVSIATVSRVLNGREDVAPETRSVVQRVIQENGYTANRSARSLSGGRSGLVGVVVPLVYPAYFSGILAGAAEALSEQGMQIVLSPTMNELEREVSLVDRIHGLTDGALFILPQESSDELARLLDRG